MRDKRRKRDLHGLNADGMVACNPRDREAAHRAQFQGIATGDVSAVTCTKCLKVMHRARRDGRSRPLSRESRSTLHGDAPSPSRKQRAVSNEVLQGRMTELLGDPPVPGDEVAERPGTVFGAEVWQLWRLMPGTA